MPDMEQWLTGRLLSTAARLVEHAWNEQLVTIGVTHAGVIALGVLSSQGPMTQASLAQIVRVQAQTMGKTLGRLESRGHITRVRSEQDKRSHLVSITEAGAEALHQAQEIERNLMPGQGLTDQEFRRQLMSVIRALDEPRLNWVDPGIPEIPGPGIAQPVQPGFVPPGAARRGLDAERPATGES